MVMVLKIIIVFLFFFLVKYEYRDFVSLGLKKERMFISLFLGVIVNVKGNWSLIYFSCFFIILLRGER